MSRYVKAAKKICNRSPRWKKKKEKPQINPARSWPQLNKKTILPPA